MRITVLQKQRGVNNYFCTTGFIFLLVLLPVQAEQGKQATHQESPNAQSGVNPPATPSGSAANDADVKQPERPVQESKGSQDEAAGGDKVVTRAEWIQIGINALLFLVVLGQTLIYIQQRKIMQRQIDNATIGERAYLGVKDVKIINPIMGNTLVIYGLVFNGGRTPARNVERKFQIGIMPEPTPFDWNDCSERSDFSMIPASAERRFSFPDLPFTKEIFAEFEAGRRNIYLDGEFRFIDFMGLEQIFAFGMTCRASDNGDFHERYQRQSDAHPN